MSNFDWKEQAARRDFIESAAFIVSLINILLGIVVLPLLLIYIYFIWRIGGWRNEISQEICTGDNIENPKLWEEAIKRSFVWFLFNFFFFCIALFLAVCVLQQFAEFVNSIID